MMAARRPSFFLLLLGDDRFCPVLCCLLRDETHLPAFFRGRPIVSLPRACSQSNAKLTKGNNVTVTDGHTPIHTWSCASSWRFVAGSLRYQTRRQWIDGSLAVNPTSLARVQEQEKTNDSFHGAPMYGNTVGVCTNLIRVLQTVLLSTNGLEKRK